MKPSTDLGPGAMAPGPVHKVSRPVFKHLAGPFYAVCFLLVVIPAVDLATNVWPLRLTEIGWRYGTTGLMSGFLLTPLLGLVLAMALARLMVHSRLLRTLGVLAGVAALLLLAISGSFALDAIQIRPDVPPDARSSFEVGVVKAGVKNLLVAATLLWLAVGATRDAQR